jgi:CheY-like chemotaxis protein
MGMMDGITLARSIKKLTPEIKVIVSSGHVQKENQEALEAVGVKVILEKPYTAEKLLRCVKQAFVVAPGS